MSSQVTVDLAELRRVVGEANRISQALGFGAEDPETGLQLMEHWLPEPIKKLLIEEHERPDGKKTHMRARALHRQGTSSSTGVSSPGLPLPRRFPRCASNLTLKKRRIPGHIARAL